MAKHICLGQITRPHGVRGEVCVDWYAEDTAYLDGEIFLEFPDGSARTFAVRSWRPHKNGLLVCLEGVNDRNAAELLRGVQVCVARESLPELSDNEAYIEDLFGRRVVLADGTEVGVLHHIEMPAGQMLFALRDAEWEYLFPAREEFIVSLQDPIVINPPQGLLETCRIPLQK